MRVLVEFSVENFLSFRDEQRFSMVASKERADSKGVIEAAKSGDDGLLACAAIYGPNAAGKSNLVQAINYVKVLITNSFNRGLDDGTGIQTFRLDAQYRDQATKFEVIFLQNKVRYDYSLVVNANVVVEESLYAYPKGKAQLWYRRSHDHQTGKPVLSPGRNLRGKLDVLRSFVRPNLPVLSLAILSNHPQLTEVYYWFDQKLTIWLNNSNPNSNPAQERQFMTVIVAGMPQIHKPLSQLLHLADVGIRELNVREDITTSIAMDDATEVLPFRIHEEPQRRQRYVRFLHGGTPDSLNDSLFSIEDESRGTQQLFVLGTVLLNGLQRDQIVIVDEMDASLHPQLVRSLVGLYQNDSHHEAQLIFNTHDASLLGANLLERDQIWFVEKDNKGASHLYPLLEFQPQETDESLEESYLRGRFGAVPLIDRLTWQEIKGDAAS